LGLEVAVQVLIVFIGGSAFQVTRVGIREWGISVLLGAVSIPLGAVVRLLPNGPFDKLFKEMKLLPKPTTLPLTRPDMEWNSAIMQVRDNLGLFSQIRSGRLRSSSHVNKSRLARLRYDDERLRLYVVPILADGRICSDFFLLVTDLLSWPWFLHL
jgi:Ca2+-transporting ATPase